jgi:hypothetical protein
MEVLGEGGGISGLLMGGVVGGITGIFLIWSGLTQNVPKCRGEWHRLRQHKSTPLRYHRGYNLSLRKSCWFLRNQKTPVT